MKKTILACALTLLFLTGWGKEVIKIGIVGPFSGDMESLGKDYKNAALMAIEEIKGMPTKNEYQFIFEDDQTQNRLTALAANKLISEDKADALITFSAGPGNVVKPQAKRHNIIQMNVSFDTMLADGVNNFTYTTPPQAMAAKWVELAKKQSWKRVTVIEETQQGVRAVVDAVEKETKNSGVALVRGYHFNPGERDFRTLILKVKETKPDAVFVMALLPEIEIIGRQVKVLTPTMPLTSVWSFDILREFEFYKGSYYVSTGMPAESFLKKFKAKYAYTTAGDQLNSYDMIKILVQAYEEGGKPGAAKILRETKEFDSLMGNTHCDARGVFYTPTSLKMVTTTGLQVVEEIK